MPSTKIPIKVQKRSGFDWSHHNALSQKIGQIVPIFSNEVIPNTKIYLRYAMAGSMPPLSSDTYMKCYYDVRAFFCPMRLLYGGFESWFTNYPYNTIGSTAVSSTPVVVPYTPYLPVFSFDYNDAPNFLGSGTLADYLGFPISTADVATADQNYVLSTLPFLCYHKIVDDWFRQPNIQVSKFARPSNHAPYLGGAHGYCVANMPFVSFDSSNYVVTVTSSGSGVSSNCLFADNSSVFDLCSANYDYDYFTNCAPSAQLGSPMSVSSASSFTIQALRAANSLQQFAELNMLAGSNLVDSVKARYGANLHDSIAQRAVYLGGARIDIANKSVDVTTNTSAGYTVNPFINCPGASGGKVYAQGTDVIIDNFVANEPGYIMVVGVVIPKVTYSTGVRRYLRHYTAGAGTITDMANPLLQNAGNQPVFQYELNGSLLGDSTASSNVFGYTDRYAEYMTMEDECHGLLRIGENLGSFVAQRAFTQTDSPVIGTNFLQVPISAIDNVAAVSGQLSGYGFYGQFAFDCKVSQPLAQYSLPSLQNPAYEHGKTVMVHRGGFRF